jgi:hypothetical protein
MLDGIPIESSPMDHLEIPDAAFLEDAIDPADAWHAAGRFLATVHRGAVVLRLYEGPDGADVRLVSRDHVLELVGRAIEEGREIRIGVAP